MTNQVTSATPIMLGNLDVSESGNLSIMFAALQLGLADKMKSDANGLMDKTEANQTRLNQIAEEIKKLEPLLTEAKRRKDAYAAWVGEMKAATDRLGEKGMGITKADDQAEMAKLSVGLQEFFKQHFQGSPFAHLRGHVNANLTIETQKANELEAQMKALTAEQEKLGSTNQTELVEIENIMGQYNSYLQGASKAVSDALQFSKGISSRF